MKCRYLLYGQILIQHEVHVDIKCLAYTTGSNFTINQGVCGHKMFGIYNKDSERNTNGVCGHKMFSIYNASHRGKVSNHGVCGHKMFGIYNIHTCLM